MLDLDSPMAPHIIAAANQLDMILDRCKRTTIVEGRRRQFMIETVRPSFAALRWLNVQHFGASPKIDSAISELERQVDCLAVMPSRSTERSNECPVCGSRLTERTQYEPIPYCSQCLGIIIGSLQQVENGFGTWVI